jgi:PiT family inorganic phosphate transporter
VTSSLLIAFALCLSFFVAATVGASSVSVSMAPAIGSNSVGVLRGALLVGIFGFIGSVAQGARVTTGVSDRIVEGTISFEIGLVSLLVIGTCIGLGILAEHSIPAAFSTVGSVAGAGIAAGRAPNLDYWWLTFASWIATGVIAAVLAFGFLVVIRHLSEFFEGSTAFEALAIAGLDEVILTAGVVFSFVGGGSQVGLAIGPLVGVVDSVGIGLGPLLVFGGLGILAGSWVKSPVMLNAVGRQYASFGPETSLAVLLTAIILVQIVANVLGVPISYNHVIISSIIGCSLISSERETDARKLAGTLVSWIATVIGSFLAAYGLYFVFVL